MENTLIQHKTVDTYRQGRYYQLSINKSHSKNGVSIANLKFEKAYTKTLIMFILFKSYVKAEKEQLTFLNLY